MARAEPTPTNTAKKPLVPSARIASGELAGLDALHVDALVLPIFEGTRQPKGVLGHVDWRLAGRVGRLLASGRFRGARGEHLLMAGLGRIGAERVFLLGLGPAGSLGSIELEGRVSALVDVVARANAEVIALGPPVLPAADEARAGPEGGEVKVAVAWLQAAKGASFAEVVLLDDGGRLSRAREALSQAAKRGGLALDA